MANKRNGTLYIGVTSNLVKRIWEHKNDLLKGFTNNYQVHNLVYYEIFDNPENAIAREKQLKWWRRKWKLALVEKDNPDWNDLFSQIA